MEQERFDEIVEKVIRELTALQSALNTPAAGHSPAASIPRQAAAPPQQPAVPTPAPQAAASKAQKSADLIIDLPDPTTAEKRSQAGIDQPVDSEGLQALMDVTPARIGQGRAGPRFRSGPWLLFQADQAITQDTLFRDVDDRLLASLNLFKVKTKVTGGKQEYLLRPDLGRQLDDESRRILAEKCVKKPQVQVCVGDGLSAQAIEANLGQILPVIQQGCQSSGLTLGTPFFIQYCRVGVMNDIGDIIQPEVLMLLIGERPGLGRAESMSIYLGYHPQSGHTDAERDVICNIFNGGTNPLEAGAYAVQMIQKMLQQKASGVKLKLAER